MSKIRSVIKSWKSKSTLEGAGVHLKRAFGYYEMPLLDPFLMLDDFHSDDPAEYSAGFPWHPHRGMETITYMLHGDVRHKDSMGNSGVVGPGDVQWMTAGSGIIHEEMPEQENGLMWGFQLWANLPAASKMMDPRYQDVSSGKIPEYTLENGTRVRVICGRVNGVAGPVQDIVIDPEYFDVTVPPGAEFTHPVHEDYTAFAYMIEGEAFFGEGQGEQAGAEGEPGAKGAGGAAESRGADAETLVVLGDGDSVTVSAKDRSARFLFLTGKPIKEPIAWRGPIVMNTQDELLQAFREYADGTFIRHRAESAQAATRESTPPQ